MSWSGLTPRVFIGLVSPPGTVFIGLVSPPGMVFIKGVGDKKTYHLSTIVKPQAKKVDTHYFHMNYFHLVIG